MHGVAHGPCISVGFKLKRLLLLFSHFRIILEIGQNWISSHRADIARSINPAISLEKENVPARESGERNAQRAPCQTLGATIQAEVCVPSTDVTPECTPRRSGRASKPSVCLQRV